MAIRTLSRPKLSEQNIFRRLPAEDWSRLKRLAFWSWNIGFVLLSGFCLGIISLRLAIGSYTRDMCQLYWDHPLVALLNILPVMALSLFLYGLTGRTAVSFFITAAATLGFSAGNFFKLVFRDDPLMAGDLMYLREAGQMSSRYELFWTFPLKAAVVCSALGLIFLLLLARGKPRRGLRIGLTAAGLIMLAVLVPVTQSETLYGKTAHFDELEHQYSATDQYIAHGFVYPFLHSISDTVERAPDGYRRSDAETLLTQYEDADIPEDQKVNVIGIMLEAYNDFTRLGAPQLASDIYATWHQLEQEGYSGNLVTNIFAGGTIDTERCFLTGFSDHLDFRWNTNSYVWYFRQQGYTVEGMHPSNEWFYNRSNVTGYLGFEDYFFMENYFSNLTTWGTAGDSIFFPELLSRYQEAVESGTPYFNFSVTYQGHGPYSDTDFYWPGEPSDYVVNNGEYTSEEHHILSNYFASIQSTNEYLAEFTDALREDDAPVVLVLFGDHNPWMGDGGSLYETLGIDFDLDTQQGFLNYYSTRYIIWANDAAKEVLGSDFQGEGPDLGPYFLMNQLFDLCGWTGPAYMQALRPIAQLVPVVHISGQYMTNGTMVSALPPDAAQRAAEYRTLQYYQRHNFAYGKE